MCLRSQLTNRRRPHQRPLAKHFFGVRVSGVSTSAFGKLTYSGFLRHKLFEIDPVCATRAPGDLRHKSSKCVQCGEPNPSTLGKSRKSRPKRSVPIIVL